MLSKCCISIQTLRFKRRFSHTVDASLSVSFIMARLMKQHYKQNWPHNTRLSIQLAQWPLPMGAVWLFYFKFGAVLRHGNTHHVVFALLTSSGPIFSHKWQKHFNGHVTEAQSATASATLGAVAVFLLLLLLLLVKIAGKYSLETKIQMKILLNSIGQTLQEHGPSTHCTAM